MGSFLNPIHLPPGTVTLESGSTIEGEARVVPDDVFFYTEEEQKKLFFSGFDEEEK